jgi:hypothetical protein
MRAVAALVAVAMVAIATPSPKVFAFQGTAAAKSDAPSPAGKWKLSLDTPHGTMVMNFDLKMEKDKLTGTMTNDMMGTVPVSGTYADGKLAMVAQGQATINFNFTFKDKDTLTGNLSSEMGDMACSAARVKEKV